MFVLKNVKSFISLWMLVGWASFLILVVHNHESNGSVLNVPQIALMAPKPAPFNNGSNSLSLARDSISRGSFITETLAANDIVQNVNTNAYENNIAAQPSSSSSSNSGSGNDQEVESEEYPSFQDFLERLSDVGYGYIIRDLLTAYITEDHEIKTVIGDLGRVGVVALAAQLIGQTGNITGIPEDKSRNLVRLSRYTGVGITLIGTYFDLYLLFDSIGCLIRERRVRQICLLEEDSDSNLIHKNIDTITKKLKKIEPEFEKEKTKENEPPLKWKTIFDHGNEEDAGFCEEMRKQAEYGESLGLGQFLCRRSHPIIEIIAAAIATVVDSVTFATPQYGNLAALGEALYQILAFIYVAAEEGGHFNNVDGHSVFDLGEFGELIYRELKGLLTEPREPLPGIPDWMPALFSHH